MGYCSYHSNVKLISSCHCIIAELRRPEGGLIWERKGNPSMDFLMIIMASGIARGRVRTTTTTTATTESRKMAAIIEIIA